MTSAPKYISYRFNFYPDLNYNHHLCTVYRQQIMYPAKQTHSQLNTDTDTFMHNDPNSIDTHTKTHTHVRPDSSLRPTAVWPCPPGSCWRETEICSAALYQGVSHRTGPRHIKQPSDGFVVHTRSDRLTHTHTHTLSLSQTYHLSLSQHTFSMQASARYWMLVLSLLKNMSQDALHRILHLRADYWNAACCRVYRHRRVLRE